MLITVECRHLSTTPTRSFLPSTCPASVSVWWFMFLAAVDVTSRPATGINVLDLGGETGRAAGCVGTDPLRLTVSFEGGIGGYEADEILIEGTLGFCSLSELGFVVAGMCGSRGARGGWLEHRNLWPPVLSL